MPQPSNYRPVKLAELRKIKLPPAPAEGEPPEPDHVTALRSVLKRHRASGDRFRVSVPDCIAGMVPSEQEPAGNAAVDITQGPQLLELDDAVKHAEPLDS